MLLLLPCATKHCRPCEMSHRQRVELQIRRVGCGSARAFTQRHMTIENVMSGEVKFRINLHLVLFVFISVDSIVVCCYCAELGLPLSLSFSCLSRCPKTIIIISEIKYEAFSQLKQRMQIEHWNTLYHSAAAAAAKLKFTPRKTISLLALRWIFIFFSILLCCCANQAAKPLSNMSFCCHLQCKYVVRDLEWCTCLPIWLSAMCDVRALGVSCCLE